MLKMNVINGGEAEIREIEKHVFKLEGKVKWLQAMKRSIMAETSAEMEKRGRQGGEFEPIKAKLSEFEKVIAKMGREIESLERRIDI